jgi:integrase
MRYILIGFFFFKLNRTYILLFGVIRLASIQKRGERSFLLVVETGYGAKGKRKKRTKTIRIDDDKLLKTTKKLRDFLELELAKFQMEVESGEYIAPQKTLFKDFVIYWEEKYGVKELGGQTFHAYKTIIKNHILPYFENMRLEEVKPVHVLNFMDQLKRHDGGKEQLSIGTIQYIYRVLRNVFQRAVDWKIIKNNPVADVKKPKSKNNHNDEINVYSENEVEALFKEAENEPFHWRVFIALALATGLRRGELLGLEWSHVNLDDGAITIKQTIGIGQDGKPAIKGTKSKNSKRVVSLPSSIIDELKLYKDHWEQEKKHAGEKWVEQEHEWLFCNVDGKHFYPTSPTTWWNRFIERTEIRHIRLHDLRHTSATLLINQGVHAKIISERLGHSNIRITMDTYGHALQTADKEAAEKLDGLFSKN